MSRLPTQLVTYSVRLTVGQLEWLQALSDKTQVPMVRTIRNAIDEYIERNSSTDTAQVSGELDTQVSEPTPTLQKIRKNPTISYR